MPEALLSEVFAGLDICFTAQVSDGSCQIFMVELKSYRIERGGAQWTDDDEFNVVAVVRLAPALVAMLLEQCQPSSLFASTPTEWSMAQCFGK
jgi:hypothetical protein